MEIHNFFYYLLKVSGLMAMFFIFYKLLFEKYSNFKWNRIYLLGSVGLAWIIPLINFGEMAVLTNSSGFKVNTFEFISGIQPLSGNLPSIWQRITFDSVAFSIYYIGIFIFLTKFIKNVLTIYRISKGNSYEKDEGYYIFKTNLQFPTFSFFKLIFLNKDFQQLTPEEKQQVILHEKTHVNCFHSIDVVFMEFAAVFLWFNPFMNLIKKSIQNVHEFEADLVVSNHTNKNRYLKLIATMVISRTHYSKVVNSFGAPQIKKRLEMLTNKKKNSFLRILIFIPLFFSLLYLFGGFAELTSPEAQSINHAILAFKNNDSNNDEYNKGIKILFQLIRDNIAELSVDAETRGILYKLFPNDDDFSDGVDNNHRIIKLSYLMDFKIETKEGANISKVVYNFLKKAANHFNNSEKPEGVLMIMKSLILTLKFPEGEN